jgi:Transposase
MSCTPTSTTNQPRTRTPPAAPTWGQISVPKPSQVEPDQSAIPTVDWCAQITLATLDPAAGYRKALDANLPNAIRVVDHFHAIKLANAAIDDCRRRVQQEQHGHRGRKGDPLYRGRRVFLTAYERLTDDRLAWMFDLLAVGDPYGELGAAILAKELLREVYDAVDVAHARRQLVVFLQHCADAEVPEVTPLARTIDRWRPEILAYHTCGGASNGRVENVHMLAEKIRRNAHGFANHTNYRRRLIGRLGIKWAIIPTRRIRGRQPHSVGLSEFRCNRVWVGHWLVGNSRSSNMMAKALSAGFQRTAHRCLPRPVGSRDLITRYRHLIAACSLGK